MKRSGKIALVFMVVSALAAGALQAKGKTYVSPADIDLTKLLPPPPAQDSEQTKKEIKEILDFQQRQDRKNDGICRPLTREINVFRFADMLGEKFTKENLPFISGVF